MTQHSLLTVKRRALLKKRALDCRADIVFYGDSLTHYWETEGKEAWLRHLAPLNAESFGVEGDTTRELKARLEEGEMNLALDPKICVLLIGTNNTTANWGKEPVEETLDGIREIAEMLLHKFPLTRLIIEEIFPRGRAVKNAVRAKGQKINEVLRTWNLPRTSLRADGALLLDDEGRIRPEYTTDYIHLSPEGYELWAAELSKGLQDMTAL